MVETFLLHLQLFILISYLFSYRQHQITWCPTVIEVVGHEVLHAAELTLLTHVEVAHQHDLHIVIAHQVHESVLLVLR